MSDESNLLPLSATRAEQAGARSHVYGLLARIFREQPDDALLDHLQSPAVQMAWAEDDYFLIAPFLANDGREHMLAVLAEEFTRLFLGPGPHLSLHESVLIPGGSGLLWGKETVNVRAFMIEAGFLFANERKVLPDHLCLELEFMAHLCQEEARFWRAGEQELAHNVISWQSNFLTKHLNKWVSIAQKKLNQASPPLFYSLFMDLLCSFVAQEMLFIFVADNLDDVNSYQK